MAVVKGGGTSPALARQKAKIRLGNLVKSWRDIQEQIKAVSTAPNLYPTVDLDKLKKQLQTRQSRISDILSNRPGLVSYTVNQLNYEGPVPTRVGEKAPAQGEVAQTQGGGGGTAGGGGGGGGGGGRNKPERKDDIDKRNPLLGKKGKDWTVIRTPRGNQMAVWKFKVGGNVVKVAVQLPRRESELRKYGVKKGEGRQLSKQQMKRIENIGWADEMNFRSGDKNVLKGLTRSLKRQYGGQPILDNDEVMGLIIANSVLGWTPGEFENQLRNTKWYRKTNEYQRDWALTMSPKQKKDTIRQTTEQVVNHLENVYGLDWMKHVEGGMAQAKKWAEKIASGVWGTSDAGFRFWSERQFDNASDIDGTPAWMERESEQEKQREWLNRPENMFEQLRGQAMQWLGPQLRPDRETLMGWAKDLVSQNKSEADWMRWLRQQSKALHPWKDENTPWQDMASSYRQIAENVIRAPIEWDDPLLQKLANENNDAPLSARDFELAVRSDDRAWAEGTALYDEGLGLVRALEATFRGVG